jgi:hypothetical protein
MAQPDAPQIDVHQTDRLAELIKASPGDRDAAWFAEFLAAAPTAAFRVSAGEMIRGPDGFSYLAFVLPAKDEEFTGFSLRAVLDLCLEKGIGIAMSEADGATPFAAFTYGQLWAYKMTGRFDAAPATATPDPGPQMLRPAGVSGPSAAPAAAGDGTGQVLVGMPSDSYFPPFARGVVREYLKMNGVPTPRVALTSDPQGKTPRALLFNLYLEDFQGEDHFKQVAQRLLWYMPPGYAVQPLTQRGSRGDEMLKEF